MSKSVPTIPAIQRKVAAAAFGRPLITNVHRGLVAEAIVAAALEPEWRWCSGDYSSWDFERSDGLKLEVKQSAARQSWASAAAKPTACSFDIAKRTGRWENGVDWIAEPGRSADLYVFAHHPVTDAAADHRDPSQWLLYVIVTSRLPATKRIGLACLRALGDPCSFQQLAAVVTTLADSLRK